MKKYCIGVREVWIQLVTIEAESEVEAIDAIAGGDGEQAEEGIEYSHTLDPETWTVEKL